MLLTLQKILFSFPQFQVNHDYWLILWIFLSRIYQCKKMIWYLNLKAVVLIIIVKSSSTSNYSLFPIISTLSIVSTLFKKREKFLLQVPNDLYKPYANRKRTLPNCKYSFQNFWKYLPFRATVLIDYKL